MPAQRNGPLEAYQDASCVTKGYRAAKLSGKEAGMSATAVKLTALATCAG